MKKQSQTLETEKNDLISHLDKQTKRSEQLETELHFQLEEERTKLQQESGNLQYVEITINLLSYIHSC